jgi:hypothetical protein
MMEEADRDEEVEGSGKSDLLRTLWAASRRGQHGKLNLFIRFGADVNEKTYEGCTRRSAWRAFGTPGIPAASSCCCGPVPTWCSRLSSPRPRVGACRAVDNRQIDSGGDSGGDKGNSDNAERR